MLRGKMNHVNLTVIEREPQVGLILGFARQEVSFHIGCIVVVSFVVAHSRHEGSVGCKAFS